MNWDISIGRVRQWYGRVLQRLGRRFTMRHLVLDGEATEYAGRLQMRYGLLKHQVQWNSGSIRLAREAIPVKKSIPL